MDIETWSCEFSVKGKMTQAAQITRLGPDDHNVVVAGGRDKPFFRRISGDLRTAKATAEKVAAKRSPGARPYRWLKL